MIAYLIKLTFCTLLLYIIYILLLEREKIHNFKRGYLLFSLVFSMLVPFISLNIDASHLSQYPDVVYTELGEAVMNTKNLPAEYGITMQPIERSLAPIFNHSLLILIVYMVITSLFLFRLLKNCRQMLVCGRQNSCINYQGVNVALIKERLIPHSFGRYIFINKEDYENGLVADEIILHEWAHVTQRHTFDIIFIELIIVFGWFNPVFYLYKNKIRQNHEFLADDTVISERENFIPAYQSILINQIPQKVKIGFTSNFDFIITKKRLIMMTKKKTSKKGIICRIIALISVFIAAIFVFSTKTIAGNNVINYPEQTVVTDSFQVITPGRGASQEQIDEFQKIVSKYFKDEKWITFSLSDDDQARLYAIYVQMNVNQRKEQRIFFVGPFTSEWARKSITQNEWKLWNMPNKGNEIRLDGKIVDHSALASYNRKDIVFFISRFTNDKKEKFRIDLWTKKGYEEYCQQYEQQIPVSKLLEIPPQTWYKTNKEKNIK